MNEPLNVISLGAGVQSSTMAFMAARGELKPPVDFAVFADTQDEPDSVYRWLSWLRCQLPFPVHVVTRSRLSDSALDLRVSKKSGHTYLKTGLPATYRDHVTGKLALGMRQCTRDFKIDPIRKFLREHRDGRHVIVWIGISLDEAHRMKPARDRWQTHVWPLVDAKITRQDCLEWMRTNGYPQPPRSACVFCPFHSDEEWLRLQTQEPHEFAKALKFERDLQAKAALATALHGKPFLNDSGLPLDEIDFAVLVANKASNHNRFGNECEGMCGV